MPQPRVRALKWRRVMCVSVVCLLMTLPMARGRVAAHGPDAGAQERFVEAVGRIPQSVVEKRNEFILRAPANRVAEIARRHGLTIIRTLDPHAHDVFLVEGPSTFGTRFNAIRDADLPALEQFVGEVQGDPEVQHFEANTAIVTPELPSGISLNQTAEAIQASLTDRTIVDYFGTPAWRGYVNQPAAGAIHLSAAQDAGATGAGIIAIIDTGVDPDHPLLQGSLVPGYDFITDSEGGGSEWSDVDGSLVSILDGSLVSILDGTSVVVLNSSTVGIVDQDTGAALEPRKLPAAFGHGTMVAGLVHLVAPTAKIMPLKAFTADGASRVFDVVRAIYYAVEHGARVINMSFSATAISPEIAHAINVATSNGVTCVASAGNLGQELLVYPGALRNVLGVASTTSTTPATRSSFSNYGAALVSLGAPGEGVITIYPGGNYAGAWGTSFSAPLVAGAAALLLQADPDRDQARADVLLGNAERMDPGTGKGRLNLDQTVSKLDETPPAVTVTAPTDGGVVFGTVGIAASATDNMKVASVTFFLDDNALGPEDTVAPYEATWWTTGTTNGGHVLKAVARDGSGNQSSSSIMVTVSNDQVAPTVALTNPAAGMTVSGTVTLKATATDDNQVFGVQFKVDGAPLDNEDGAEPFEAVWDTLTASNGTHTLTAVARDVAGKETTASTVVTVANDLTPTVVLTEPAAGSVTAP